ncbi:hypothetical protein TNCV_1534721 [Trichonephila clavipes]|nr:hypothetical protein TNCV_1534721 [Trichonephila clavipes]
MCDIAWFSKKESVLVRNSQIVMDPRNPKISHGTTVCIVRAQVCPSREDTGRQNYLRRLVSAYLVTVLRRDTSFRGLDLLGRQCNVLFSPCGPLRTEDVCSSLIPTVQVFEQVVGYHILYGIMNSKQFHQRGSLLLFD